MIDISNQHRSSPFIDPSLDIVADMRGTVDPGIFIVGQPLL
jgi:hypothetical protein